MGPYRGTRWPRTSARRLRCCGSWPTGSKPPLARGDLALVLGGNCTIALGVMAALRRLGADAPGLLYVDRHYDINTPETTTDGALDWMGLAHALALPGCVDTVADALGPGLCLRLTRCHGSGWSHAWLPTGSASRRPGSACT